MTGLRIESYLPTEADPWSLVLSAVHGHGAKRLPPNTGGWPHRFGTPTQPDKGARPGVAEFEDFGEMPGHDLRVGADQNRHLFRRVVVV